MANVSEIEGIGPAYAAKLEGNGIKTIAALLEAGASKKGRDSIAEATGIAYDKILKWVNMADLFRIKGVGEEYSELLEAAGVDTVKELRNRNAENLHAKMEEVNEAKKLVRAMPSASQVASWVEHAKTLDPIVTH
jgi:predicted flap endonuclease-1-like 5' DNA nuclease